MTIAKDCCPLLPFWNRLADSDKCLIKENSTIQRYRHGSVVYAKGEEPVGMAMIVSGSAKADTISEKGREIQLFKLKAGSICILDRVDNCLFDFHTQIVAESDSELLVINKNIINKIKSRNVHFRCFIYELVSGRLSRVVKSLQNILFFGAEKRLAAYLIKEYERSGKKTIKMTQKEIADEINSAREVVARGLKEFVQNGCIDMIRRGELLIKDVNKLKSY